MEELIELKSGQLRMPKTGSLADKPKWSAELLFGSLIEESIIPAHPLAKKSPEKLAGSNTANWDFAQSIKENKTTVNSNRQYTGGDVQRLIEPGLFTEKNAKRLSNSPKTSSGQTSGLTPKNNESAPDNHIAPDPIKEKVKSSEAPLHKTKSAPAGHKAKAAEFLNAPQKERNKAVPNPSHDQARIPNNGDDQTRIGKQSHPFYEYMLPAAILRKLKPTAPVFVRSRRQEVTEGKAQEAIGDAPNKAEKTPLVTKDRQQGVNNRDRMGGSENSNTTGKMQPKKITASKFSENPEAQDKVRSDQKGIEQGVRIDQLAETHKSNSIKRDSGWLKMNQIGTKPAEGPSYPTPTAASSMTPKITASPARPVQAVIQAITILRANDQIKTNLIIESGSLGKMEIQLSKDLHGSAAMVYVESDSTKAILQKFIPAIHEALLEKGISLNAFNIEVGDFSTKDTYQEKQGIGRDDVSSFSEKEGLEGGYHSDLTNRFRDYGYNTIEILI